ncbi:MAG: ATP-binding cassette domain-containing protein [Marinobacter sp.]
MSSIKWYSGLINEPLTAALKPALPMLAVGTLAAALSGLTKLGALWCLVQVIDDQSVTWIIGVGVLLLASAILSSAASWSTHKAEAGFAARLRRQVAQHLIRLPASTLSRWDDKKLRSLLSNDVLSLHHLVAHLPAEIVTFAIVPLVSIAFLVAISGLQALLVLTPGAVAALYYLWFMPKISARHGEQRAKVMSEIVTAVDEYVRGIRASRIYGAQSGALASYHSATDRFTHGMITWVRKVATAAAVAVSLLQAVATFAIAYAITYQQGTAAIAAGLFFGLAIVTPSLRLGHGLDYVSAGRNAARHLTDFFREPPLPSANARVPESRVLLEAKAVTLTAGEQFVVERTDYRFSPGTMTVISGPSGAGKTTLLRALAGLEQTLSGSMRLAGVDLVMLNEEALHQAIRLLPQGSSALLTSVRENLTLADPEQADEKLEAALRQARLEVDLDAHAGNLSGGEMQRLGLARMFLTSAPVLLLDEPTSALDPDTTKHIIKSLQLLAHSQGKTIVIVSHDPVCAAEADVHLQMQGNTLRVPE